MAYNLYLPVEVETHRLLKKHDPRLRKMPSIESIKVLTRTVPNYTDTLEFIVLAEEWMWQQYEAPVIFPETKETLETIYNGKYEVTSAEGIKFPHEAFVLATPKGFTIEGREIGAVFCTFMPFYERRTCIFGPFLERVGAQAQYTTDTGIDDQPTLTLTYRMPTSDKIYRAVIPDEYLVALLLSRSPEEYTERIGNFKHYILAEGLSPDEARYQQILLRLIISTAIYTQACPDSLQAGYPGKEPKFLEPKNFTPYTRTTLRTRRFAPRDTPVGHHRTWYIRQLRHERFYQNEYSHLTPGSRFVFVSETVVGNDITPETLKHEQMDSNT